MIIEPINGEPMRYLVTVNDRTYITDIMDNTCCCSDYMFRRATTGNCQCRHIKECKIAFADAVIHTIARGREKVKKTGFAEQV